MKLIKPKTRLIILSVAAAGLIGWAAYAKFTQPKQASDTTTTETTEQQPSTDPNAGKQTDEMPAKEESTTSATPSANNQAASSSTLSVVISRAGQIDQTIQIRGLIEGTKTGSCKAKLTKSGTVVQGSHAVEFQQTGYTCGSLDIPVSQFNAGGDWQLELTVTSGGQTSAPAKQTITITK